MKVIDLTGQKFGRLTVLGVGEYYISPSGRKVKRWKCMCDCGNIVFADTSRLKKGNVKSCGCYLREKAAEQHKSHGMYGTRIYNIYTCMMQRCHNENTDDFKNYGGRGITVCDEWKNDFQAFYDWAMASGYANGLTIDRIDVNGNYCPENCRWATSKKQNNNRRNNRLITHNGETHTMAEWAEIVGIEYSILACRICNHKWPIEKALTQEVRKR